MSSNPVLYGLPEGQDARFIAEQVREAARADSVMLHVALDDSRIATIKELLSFFAPDVDVAVLPAWDCLPYDRVSPHGDIVSKRVSTLTRILDWQKEEKRVPRLILTTVNAASQRVTPKKSLEKAGFSVSKGGTLDIEAFQRYLADNGYIRTDTVREAGEYAIRGGIVDLFPSGAKEPIRMDLFGDEVETIKDFDPISQRSGKARAFFALHPVSEFFLDQDSIARFRGGYREAFGVVRGDDPLYEAISEGRKYNGMDHWLPLFFEQMDTVFDYVGKNCVVTLDYHVAQSYQARIEHIRDFYQARQTLSENKDIRGFVYHPLPVERLYVAEEEWGKLLKDLRAVSFSPFANPDTPDDQPVAVKARDFSDIRALPEGDVLKELSAYVSHLRAEGRKILIASYSEGSRERIKGLLAESGFANLVLCDTWDRVKKLDKYEIGLAVLLLDSGFVASDLAVITEQDILGDRLARKKRKKKKADNFLTEISSLSAGDLVVHVEHGVGRFEGLETLDVAGAAHDCLKIIYDGGDKLFIPVENMDLLSRFGADEGRVALDKLGGAGWQARKSKVKKDLMVMADGLLKIAAARMLRKGEKIVPQEGPYRSFVARFPYQETEDQQSAIEQVLEDLDSGRPMDRLVCGDVGFGKTEVALRAACAAAMEGFQVAVVAPTTLLARQHFRNFSDRFKGTAIRVEQLSRFVKGRDAALTRDGLRDGSVNIIVGTHAIFSKLTKFSNLGLLIVDEEQHFGVKQKERLKELKENVHILTLTATPIPRTLQMALSGVREMSIIASPPVDRLAIRTFVLPFDPMVIREALLREHYRGGQSFYVCPRVKDIKEVEAVLKELVPEIKVISAHGQMSATELEERMTAFYDGQYDVLLATNIIESGLDVPTANTMIVHRSDMFGLAQLYQIRGRIGRSKIRAYAYLTYQQDKKLTDQAQKRLEVIEMLDTLGAGFQLASHDMDIRGAGNLLGDKQSGHIKEVGVELYQQMLEEAVAAAKAGVDMEAGLPEKESWSPTINIGTSVLIPERYVEDLSVRMSLYRRLSELEDQNEVESFAAELIDRFGPLPEEVENLMTIFKIKQHCRKAGIEKIEAGPKGAVIGFYKDTPPNIPGLMQWMQEKRGAVKLRHDQKLVVIRQWDTVSYRVKGVQSLVKDLASF